MYKLIRNRCECHPETCCCHKYKVVDKNGRTMTTVVDLACGERLLKALNANS